MDTLQVSVGNYIFRKQPYRNRKRGIGETRFTIGATKVCSEFLEPKMFERGREGLNCAIVRAGRVEQGKGVVVLSATTATDLSIPVPSAMFLDSSSVKVVHWLLLFTSTVKWVAGNLISYSVLPIGAGGEGTG